MYYNHILKLKYKYAKDIVTGVKTFEIRINDRDYQVNDIISFKVIDIPSQDPYNVEEYMNNHFYRISYITDYEQKEGYIVMSIKVINI